jgi:diguanylate cyclase (GGDEF)-like protein/PAS domain S-box-containing protein
MNLSYSEYKAIVEFSPNMIWRAGIDAKCNYFNETWLRFTGKSLDEEIGDGWVQGVHTEDTEFCFKTYLEAFRKHESFEMEYRLLRWDGQWRWINDRGVPFYDEYGEFAGYIGSCIDVTEKIEGVKLIEMAHTDKLTGVYNRNYLDYLLEYESGKAKIECTDLVIVMMDIDKFKFFNDTYGHNYGDKVLKQVAQKITENLRKTDFAGRYGGDEFLVILPRTTINEAKSITERILNVVSQININDIKEKISLSIGIVKQLNEEEVSEVIERADKTMYNAKQSGGNKCFVCLD